MANRRNRTVDLVREELARLIDSEALRRAPSHARLLRYLVEQRVAGDGPALRETSIALEVFRRDPATYDPAHRPDRARLDRRLRERLETHYAHFVAPPKLRILLPRGGYAPEFVPLAPALAPAAPGSRCCGARNRSGLDALDARRRRDSPTASPTALTAAGFAHACLARAVDQAQIAVPATRAAIGARARRSVAGRRRRSSREPRARAAAVGAALLASAGGAAL